MTEIARMYLICTWELLNEVVVEKLIRHEAQPSAFDTTSELNNFNSI